MQRRERLSFSVSVSEPTEMMSGFQSFPSTCFQQQQYVQEKPHGAPPVSNQLANMVKPLANKRARCFPRESVEAETDPEGEGTLHQHCTNIQQL